jgi:hypothetical protein
MRLRATYLNGCSTPSEMGDFARSPFINKLEVNFPHQCIGSSSGGAGSLVAEPFTYQLQPEQGKTIVLIRPWALKSHWSSKLIILFFEASGPDVSAQRLLLASPNFGLLVTWCSTPLCCSRIKPEGLNLAADRSNMQNNQTEFVAKCWQNKQPCWVNSAGTARIWNVEFRPRPF